MLNRSLSLDARSLGSCSEPEKPLQKLLLDHVSTLNLSSISKKYAKIDTELIFPNANIKMKVVFVLSKSHLQQHLLSIIYG